MFRIWDWLMKKNQSPNPHYQQKLLEHQRKLRCSVCNAPSIGPAIIGDFVSTDGYQNWVGKIEGAVPETEDWETSKDLNACLKCGRLYCKRHKQALLQNGCQQCLANETD